MSLTDTIAALPLVDHHCHYFISGRVQERATRLAQVSTEADNDYPLQDTQNRLAWPAFVAEAQEFALDPAASLAPFPDQRAYATYTQRIMAHYHFQHLFIDTGFVPDDPITDLQDTAVLTGVPVRPIYRIETQAQAWFAKTTNFTDWWEGLSEEVRHARDNGFVGFKSIAAYRVGLAIQPVSLAAAQDAYAQWQAAATPRLMSQPLINYILWQLAPLIIAQHMPLQFHVGYGDADTDLYLGNPLLMRSYLQTFCPAGLTVMLLHCYPYHREAGYLSSVFPNLYFDISLVDTLAPNSVNRVLDESLELAPYTRFVFASDASTYPEMYGVAARQFKAALVHHFTDLPFVTAAQKEQWLAAICYQTSTTLYLQEE